MTSSHSDLQPLDVDNGSHLSPVSAASSHLQLAVVNEPCQISRPNERSNAAPHRDEDPTSADLAVFERNPGVLPVPRELRDEIYRHALSNIYLVKLNPTSVEILRNESQRLETHHTLSTLNNLRILFLLAKFNDPRSPKDTDAKMLVWHEAGAMVDPRSVYRY